MKIPRIVRVLLLPIYILNDLIGFLLLVVTKLLRDSDRAQRRRRRLESWKELP